jgi:AcrR family transcriptional regulator
MTECSSWDCLYGDVVPKLWTETIDAHRAAVRDSALDAVGALVAEHGLVALTMSQVAQRAGIGRATLYKYFPDAQTIVAAWHERQVARHVDQLAAAADPAEPAAVRLRTVLRTYARIVAHDMAGHHGSELATVIHRADHVHRAQQRLHGFVRDLIAEAARAGDVRDDVAADELAGYCLHALTAAGTPPGRVPADRLVAVTLDGLRTPGPAEQYPHRR